MKFLILFLIISSAWSQDVRTYGAKDLPAPFMGDEFSRSAIGYEIQDWRDWAGPVRNQGNCGACVAFAAISTLEDQLTINSGLKWKRDEYSQEALFSCGKAKCSSGWFIHDAAAAIEKNGVLDVACAPYTAGQLGKISACGNFCDNQSARTFKVTSMIFPEGTANVKEALKQGPLVTSMSVRKGFDSYKGGIFKSTIDDEVLGGHAVELVGYNDIERYWIIKNSWGEDWGEKGYARISYDDVSGVGADVYGYVVPKDEQGFKSPREDAYLQGNVKIESTFTSVDLYQKDKLIQPLGTELNTTAFPDGEYTLRSGKYVRRITIMNKIPDFKMKAGSSPAYNFDYPQSGRIYIDVSFEGSLFPEELILELWSGEKLAMRRVYRDVLSMNRLGFNSTALPNGTYDVRVKHRTLGAESPTQTMKLTLMN